MEEAITGDRRTLSLVKKETGKETADYIFSKIIGNSLEIKKVIELVKKIAKTNVTVLITGETGTGKGLIAETIHKISLRAEKPYIQVNCTAIQDTLLESELFGHEKGAFTSAFKIHTGKVERANRGTLFLDEISDMSPALQAKLLWILEDGKFERVGGEETKTVDVRIIATTNKNLEEEIERKNFREDLYYRLNQINIHLVPLRDKPEDILALASYFIEESCSEFAKEVMLSKEAYHFFLEYQWPGNVREMKNLIRQAVLLNQNDSHTLEVDDFRFLEKKFLVPNILLRSPGDDFKPNLRKNINVYKKILIIKTLEMTNWNQTEAAQLLGVRRTYLNRIIKRYGIKRNNGLPEEEQGGEKMEEKKEEREKTSENLVETLSETVRNLSSIVQKQTETILNSGIFSQADSRSRDDQMERLEEEISSLKEGLKDIESRLDKKPIFQKKKKPRGGESRYPGYQEVLDVIKKAKGNKAKAARMLGCHQATIYNWHKRALKEKKEAQEKE